MHVYASARNRQDCEHSITAGAVAAAKARHAHLRDLLVEVVEREGQPHRVEAQQLQRLHDGGKVAALPGRRPLRVQAVHHGLAVVEAKPVVAQAVGGGW
jgi:hypothetical protein